MSGTTQNAGALRTIIKVANPYFVAAVVIIPIGALIYAMSNPALRPLNYIHVMGGVLWTGIDVFMGFILGPVLGGVDPAARASIFKRLTPKLTFVMPVLAAVTVTAGIELSQRMGMFSFSNPKIILSLIIVTILTIQGFGILLPNEIRILRQLLSDKPDIELIGKIGMKNARLGGIQGVLQIGLVFTMTLLRF